MRRIFFPKLLLLIAAFFFVTQSTQGYNSVWERKKDGDYGCKSDADGGHINLVEKGEILKILNGNSLIFKNEKNQKRKVNLIALNSDSNKTAAKAFLNENALNKTAELIYSSSQLKSKNVNGIIEIEGKDINRLMLELGITKYEDSKPYQISYFHDCVYSRAESKAKTEKLGFWAK
jgi:endonuclease YncB( thermonuclease family)